MEPKTHQQMLDMISYAMKHNIAEVYATVEGNAVVAAIAFKATTNFSFTSMDGEVEYVSAGDYVVADSECTFFYSMTDDEFTSVHVQSAIPPLVGGFCNGR